MFMNEISRYLVAFITITEGVFVLSGLDRTEERGMFRKKLVSNLLYIGAAVLTIIGTLTLFSRLGWDQRYVSKAAIILSLTVYAVLFSKTSGYTKATVICVYYTASLLMRNLRSVLFQHFQINLTVYNVLSIVLYSALLIVSGMFIRKFSVKSRKAVPKSFWLTIIAVLGGYELIGIVIDLFWENGTLTDLQTRMWNNLTAELAIFLLCLIGYYMVYNVAAYYSQRRELELLRQKQNEVMTDLNRANQMYDEIRVLRHEFKNHVLTMQAFTRMEEYDKLKRYLDKYLKTDGKALTTIDCGNKVLNNILNYKRSDLADRGVTFEPSIRVPAELPFEESDIASLLVNLIDNAAEAALKTPSPSVTLKVIVEKSYCFVTVVNPVNTVVLADNPSLSTTKSDSANHGIGLRVVRSIVEKYNGYLDFEQKEETFIVSAMLSMK